MTCTVLKRLLTKVVTPVIALTLILSTSATAESGGHGGHGGGRGHGGGGHGAPEIDPSLAAAGIIVLVGGTLVLTGRRRPKTA